MTKPMWTLPWTLRTKTALVPIVFSLLLPALPAAADVDNTDPFARDLLILADWFEGEFDNEEQVWFQADPRSATPDDERHERIHTIHTRLDLPAFGAHVFYVEEYKDNDPAAVFRQRLVLFSSDREEPAIRMRQGFFNEPKRFLGAHRAPEKLAGLTTDDVFFLDQCDVFWRRSADQYEGGMKPKSCVFGEGKDRRYSVHNMVLSAGKYWRVDSTFRISDGSLYVGHSVDRPFKMRRARVFICEAAFRPEGGPEQLVSGLRVHSQGGEATLTDESTGKVYLLRIRDKEYPYYRTRPDFLYFSLREQGEFRSVAYGVHDSNSRRMALSVGWMMANCHLDGYEFREPLAVLDAR